MSVGRIAAKFAAAVIAVGALTVLVCAGGLAALIPCASKAEHH
jgi:hypothetical protein